MTSALDYPTSARERSRLSTLEDFARALGCGRRGCLCAQVRRGRLTTHCPAHPDRNPSLGVVERGDRLLWHCWAGCEQDAVTAGLRDRGLLATPDPARRALDQANYQSRRKARILVAAEAGNLSWEAAHWMLWGYLEERDRRHHEWQAIGCELMARAYEREAESELLDDDWTTGSPVFKQLGENYDAWVRSGFRGPESDG